jgi:hypothetical protein
VYTLIVVELPTALYPVCEACKTREKFDDFCSGKRPGGQPLDCPLLHDDIFDVKTHTLLERLFQKVLDLTSYKLSEDVKLK